MATTTPSSPTGPGSPEHPSLASGQKRRRLEAASVPSLSSCASMAPMSSQQPGAAGHEQRSSSIGPPGPEGAPIPIPSMMLPVASAMSMPVQASSAPLQQHGLCSGEFGGDGDGTCVVHSLTSAPWLGDFCSNVQASCQEPATQPQLAKEVQPVTQPHEAVYLRRPSPDLTLLGSQRPLPVFDLAVPVSSTVSANHMLPQQLLPQKDPALQPAARVEAAAQQCLPSPAVAMMPVCSAAVAALVPAAAHAPPATHCASDAVLIAPAAGYQHESGWLRDSSAELRATCPKLERMRMLLAADNAWHS